MSIALQVMGQDLGEWPSASAAQGILQLKAARTQSAVCDDGAVHGDYISDHTLINLQNLQLLVQLDAQGTVRARGACIRRVMVRFRSPAGAW